MTDNHNPYGSVWHRWDPHIHAPGTIVNDQYLSQQFVDTLCLAEGLTDELLAEIERVIYQAHPIEERMGTTTFRELLDLRAAPGREARLRHEETLAEEGREINIQRERRASLPSLRKQREDKREVIAKDKGARKSLIGKGSDERAKLLDDVSTAAESVRSKVEQARRRQQALASLQGEVSATRMIKSPASLRRLQESYAEAGLSAENWKSFTLVFAGKVDEILAAAIRSVDEDIRKLTGSELSPAAVLTDPPSTTSFLKPGVEIDKQPLNILDNEIARLLSD
jgi:hypothetical protein